MALNVAAEEATVASGVTIADYLVSGVDNNVEYSAARTNAFTTNGTSTVTVSWTSHGKAANAKFSIEDGPTIDGLNMNGTWFVASVPNANSFTFTHSGTASGSTATTGSATFTFSDWQDDGKLRFLCFMSHINYDDPIKYPGSQGAAHGHMFFGNTLTDYTSTYASLRAAGNGTCDGGPLNRTAYWFPWMVNGNTNKVKYPKDMQWYYINERRVQLEEYTSAACPNASLACPQNEIRRIQRGTKVIFGFDPGKTGGAGYPDSYGANAMLDGAWKCYDSDGNNGSSGYRYLHHRSNSSLGLTSATCPASGQVQLRVSSPSCWTGELDSTTGNSPHYEHFAFSGQDGHGKLVCPSTHPYPHIQFLIIITWNYTGGISSVANWYLSSDRHNGANFEAGETFHWDMIFAWEDDIMDFWAKNIFGMYSDPNTPPYIYDGETEVDSTKGELVGGKHMRNTNSGGLGVSGITNCIWGAFTASCTLKQHGDLGVGITDTEVDIPANIVRRGRKARGKMR